MRFLAVAATSLAVLGLAACKPPAEIEAQAPADAPSAEASATVEAPTAASPEAAAGEPAFAAAYPDAALTAPVTRAEGPAGHGGVVQFTTQDAPDDVVGFYKQRAEAAGLVSISTLSQGGARGYKAASDDGVSSVEVVATPIDGATAVQLSWNAAR